MSGEIIFTEIELGSDLKKFVSFSDNSCSSDQIKEEIIKSGDDDFFKVTKTIASPMKIIQIEKVDDDYIEKALA